MPFNGMGNYYSGTPIDVGGNLLRGAQAREAMTKNDLEQQKLAEQQQNQQAVNMYNRVAQNAQGGTAFDQENVLNDFQGSMAAQGQATRGQAVATAIDVPRKALLSKMAMASLGIEDPVEHKAAHEFIYKQMTPDEQRQFGPPDKWSRPQIASLVGGDDVKLMMDQWKEIYKKSSGPAATPEQSLIARSLEERLKRKPTATEIYNEERRTKKEDAQATASAKSQSAGNKPLPAGQLEGLADQKSLIKTLKDAQALAEEKDKNGNYSVDTGPVSGRTQSAKELVGMAGSKFITYKQKLSNVNNIMLKLRSGAAVTDQEYKRFLKEMPDENTPINSRGIKLTNAISYAQSLMDEKVLNFSEGGYRIPTHLSGGQTPQQSTASGGGIKVGGFTVRVKK